MVMILILALVAVSAINLLTGSVSAASGLNCTPSVSAKSSAVGQSTSYTITITNTGTSTIGSANITVPSGYSNLNSFSISSPSGESWTATLQPIKTNSKTTYYILVYGSTQGLSQGQGLTFTFNGNNPDPSGTYKWVVGINGNTTTTDTTVPQTFTVTTNISTSITSVDDAILILAIAVGIAFLNTVLNRFLINYFVGWEQYRVMQKEMNEYRQETMAAARANDKKQMEKLKKRQSQINNMQAKMLKPQMVQLGVSFLYIFIWIFVLTPTYGTTSMVYLPGIGALPVVYWYPIGSFFLGLLASRILGIMPIEP